MDDVLQAMYQRLNGLTV